MELVHASDRPLRQFARELGVNHETLRSWVNNATRDQTVPSNTTGSAEQQELRELHKRVAELELEKEIPQGSRLFRQGDGSLTYSYRFISEHRAAFGVARLCRVLQVRRPGFYEWLAAAPARAHQAAVVQELAAEIAQVHAEHRAAYGSPRITQQSCRAGAPSSRRIRSSPSDSSLVEGPRGSVPIKEIK